MAEYQYLKDDFYYNDLYDLHTIETCLKHYCSLRNDLEERRGNEGFKKYTKEEFDKDAHKAVSYFVNTIKVERYRHKKETIQAWMYDDRQKQERLDNAVEPKGIFCPQCNNPMHSTIKTLEDYLNEPMRVLFFFECPNCKKRKGVYDNCAERVSKPQLCPKCQKEVKVTTKRKGKVLIWTTVCPSCGYKEIDKDDYNQWEVDSKKKGERDRHLLEQYREEFCYSDEVGQRVVWDFDQLKVLSDQLKEREEHKEQYDAVANIKKLTIVELEKLLNKTITPQNYIKLVLSQPEFGKQLIVGFTVQDGNSARKGMESEHDFKKAVKQALEGTNWRLMSEGVIYRLGYLQGRLKAYETEEDLFSLVKARKKV